MAEMAEKINFRRQSAAKSKYFTAIIDKNYHRPIFNAVVNPTVCEFPDASKTMCDDFLRFFY